MADALAPVAVFAFNRPRHLLATLEALAANGGAAESPLFVFCDGPRSATDHPACADVRSIATAVTGFASVSVVARDRNLGCAASVIAGIDEVLLGHDRVIVIEDDIVTAPKAIGFMNAALREYAAMPTVYSVASWAPPYAVAKADYPYCGYFFPRFHCWGWATWRDRWAWNDWSVPHYDEYVAHPFLRRAHARGGADLPSMLAAQMKGRIDSWAVRAEYTRFARGAVTLYPRQSLVLNIGMDGSGRHCAASDRYGVNLPGGGACEARPFPRHVCVDKAIAGRFRRIYEPAGLLRRAMLRLRRAVPILGQRV